LLFRMFVSGVCDVCCVLWFLCVSGVCVVCCAEWD
jgi:hypothetical protein